MSKRDYIVVFNTGRSGSVKESVDSIPFLISSGTIKTGSIVGLPYEDKSLGIDTLLTFNVCKMLQNGAICHCTCALDEVVFSRANSNNYKNSDIRKYLKKLIDRFDKKMQKHFLENDIVYIDAEDEQLKVVQDKFWLLDQMELFTFYKTMEERKKKYLKDGSACYWWLRYPNTGNTYREYDVLTSGSSSINGSCVSIGCAPACLIG